MENSSISTQPYPTTFSQTTSYFYSYPRKEKQMTCLIHAKSKNQTIIASDSWSSSKDNNHIIQKIIVNKNFPLIIASAGENSARYKDGHVESILDYMFYCANYYNGKNIEECIKKLLKLTKQFLCDMSLQNTNEKLVQYYICYYDIKKRKIISKAYEIIKNNIQTFVIYIPDSLAYHSFGVYSYVINKSFKDYSNDAIDIKEKVFADINKQIDLEKEVPKDFRRVGGPIQWASISKDGVLSHGVEYI